MKKQGYTSEKFSIENTEWIQAKDLVSGDVALSADGRELVVSDVTIDERAETVYNFEVEEYHTYFVGEVGVWVHNQDKQYSDTVGRFEYKLGEWNRYRDLIFDTALSKLGKFATKYVSLKMKSMELTGILV